MKADRKRRDQALIESVASFYLQYKEVVSVEDLLSLMTIAEKLPVSKDTMTYIHYYLLYLATEDAVHSAREAKESRLTYREFATEVSGELYGSINVPVTLAVYPLMAYFTYKEGLNAPEYAVLGYLLRRIFSIVSTKKKELDPVVRSKGTLKYFDFFHRFDEALKELEALKEEFPEGQFRPMAYTDPGWLKRAFMAYDLVRGLETYEVGVRGKEVVSDRERIKLLLWKLYELYVFYLVASVLEENGFTIRKANNRYVAEKEGRRLNLVFNASLNSSKLRRVDGLTSPGDIERFRGRPDLSLYGEKPVIFECKYSTSVGYITMGRFKVMAYTYEYDPCLSVLVYPGLEKGVDYDEEDEATRELNERVEREGGVLEFEYNGHTILVARVDPLLGVGENLKVVERVLTPLLKGVESSCTE